MKMFARSEKFNEGETIKADAIGATDKPRRCGAVDRALDVLMQHGKSVVDEKN